jgi:polar amino acid transport system permease protein
MRPKPPPPPAPRRRRVTPLDVAIIATVAGLAAFVVYRVNFVLVYDWHWPQIFEYVVEWDEARGILVPNLLLKGLMTTLRLAFWGTLLAAAIGLLMGLARTSSNLFARTISRLYVELIRNIPPVVFIFIFYFFISSQLMPLLGVDDLVYGASPTTEAVMVVLFGPLDLFSNFLAGLICLAMFEGAYITEIVRAGIQSIPRGQWEGARAVGLSRGNVLRDVILPQAIRKILPPLAGQFITLIKDSSLVALISIQELSFMAMEIAISEQRFFEVWIFTGFMYFVVCYSLATVFNRMERRMAAGQR